MRRRELITLIGSALPVSAMIAALPSTSALAAVTRAASTGAGRTVKFHDGTVVPALGQGSWHLGQGRHPEAIEEEALRTGLSLGMTLIDTSGNYGDGRSEKLIGHVIAGQRDRVFLVSKVEPYQATGNGIARACEASLARLGTDNLDLYLLHWPSRDADLSSIVAAFESLRTTGKIRAWGVSNFKVSDMEALFHVPNGNHCATNQVLYNIGSRSIEYDLLPWCEQRGMPVRAARPAVPSGYEHPQRRAFSVPRATGRTLALLPSGGSVNGGGASDEFFDLTGYSPCPPCGTMPRVHKANNSNFVTT